MCKVLDSLSIDVEDSQEEACLFRLNGSKVLDEPIVDDNGIECPWMLARYLESVYQKHSSNLELGLWRLAMFKNGLQLRTQNF